MLVEDHAFQRRLGLRLLADLGLTRLEEAADGVQRPLHAGPYQAANPGCSRHRDTHRARPRVPPRNDRPCGTYPPCPDLLLVSGVSLPLSSKANHRNVPDGRRGVHRIRTIDPPPGFPSFFRPGKDFVAYSDPAEAE